MLTFLIIASAYWLLAMLWFAMVQKPIFCAYNRRGSSSPLSLRDIMAVYRHGIPTDAIISSYLAALPLLISLAATLIPGFNPFWVLTAYNLIIAIALGLLTVADALLYPFWNFKIDASVFSYLRSLKGATASVSAGYIALAVSAWIILSTLFFIGIQSFLAGRLNVCSFPMSIMLWWQYPVIVLLFILFAGALFCMIRGLGIRPNTPSIAYFSSNQFLNHCALNPGYSIVYTLSKKDPFKNRFRFMPPEKCRDIISDIFPKGGTTRKLIKTTRPNILLIEWESFGAEFSGAFGGQQGITPCFDRLVDEGIAFTDCIAGSFRTDRALVCIHSGLPAQPTTSVINHTRILPKLPGLARSLKRNGYSTVAIHGGDMSIMHKNDYYLASGHDRLIEQRDMPRSMAACKWGVHDGPAMQRAADEIIRLNNESKSPFMVTLQTLSSHEPFDVPEQILDDKIANAYAYTDRALGRLVETLKASPAWNNLLIAVVADHGLNRSHTTDNRRRYAHIPLLLLGGVINEPQKIDIPVSQTDIAATLLGQLDIDHRDFPFSRDVMSDSYRKPLGIHIFHNGIMIADSEGFTVYDSMNGRIIAGNNAEHEDIAKAILQATYEYLSGL